MNANRSWLLCVLGISFVVGACNSEILDDFGIAGYAQLQGTALQADGSPFSSVFISCGIGASGEFAGLWDADSLGRFDVTLARPGAHLPGNDTLTCIIRAPGDAPSLVSDTLEVPFTEEREARRTTVVTLQAL